MATKKILLAEDTIDKDELFELSQWIVGGNRLTKGPLTVEFEKKFAKYMGVKHAIMVNSGSSANLLMIYALLQGGSLKNNKVIAPAVSWVTTVSPLIQLGFDVELCDCNITNLGFDLEHFEELCIKNKPSFAILVHVLGHSNDMKELLQICKKYNVILIEDSCEALGSEFEGQRLGSIGRAGSFSFYYGHHISTIEGGMVVTDDDDLYYDMMSIRSHGWARDLPSNIHEKWRLSSGVDEVRDLYTFYHPGFNLRSSDLNAFLGISQLKKLDKIVEAREKNSNIYKKHLSDYWVQSSSVNKLSHFAHGVLVQNREETFKYMQNNMVETRPLICGNIGRHPFWIKHNGSESKLKHADLVHDNGLYLPNHFNLTEDDIKRVCECFRSVAKPMFFE